MKLKELLLENSRESLEELNELLQSEFKNDSKILVYRETDREINGWNSFRTSPGRDPLGSSSAVQILLDTMADNEYSNVPLRKNSKFGMTEEDLGGTGREPFGENKYIVFPDKGSNIVSFEEDTKRIREKIDVQMDSLGHFNLSPGVLKDLYQRTQKLKNDEIDKRWYKKFLESKWEKIYEEFKSGDHSFAFDTLFGYMQDYFEMMKSGIHPNSEEVVFDGRKYLYVEKPLFYDNFEFDGMWTLK